MRSFPIVLICVVFLVGELLALEDDFHLVMSRAVNRAVGCQDVYSQCRDWANRGVCQSSRYTKEAKRSLCGVSCGLCNKSSGGNDDDSQSSNSDKKMMEAMDSLKEPLGELINNLNFIVKAVKGKFEEFAKADDN